MAPWLAPQGIAIEPPVYSRLIRRDTVRVGPHYRALAPFTFASEEPFWLRAFVRGLAWLETLLVRVDATERVYTPKSGVGGEDGVVVLLTPAMAEVINKSGLIAEDDYLLALADLPGGSTAFRDLQEQWQ